MQVLAAAGRLVLGGDRVAPPGVSGARPTGEAAGFADRIEKSYRDAGFDPPKHLDLSRALGTKPAVVDGLVAHLLKAGSLVRLSPDLVVHKEAVEGVVAKLASVRGKTLAVGGFRDLLGLTRKSLIPLLEYLDSRKKTRRMGDVRVVE
jgi:selenocysteine-specific elongation factor